MQELIYLLSLIGLGENSCCQFIRIIHCNLLQTGTKNLKNSLFKLWCFLFLFSIKKNTNMKHISPGTFQGVKINNFHFMKIGGIELKILILFQSSQKFMVQFCTCQQLHVSQLNCNWVRVCEFSPCSWKASGDITDKYQLMDLAP